MFVQTVEWYPDNANRFVDKESQKFIEGVADAVLLEARAILTDEDHMDTHFLWSSGYTSKPSGTSPAPIEGVYQHTKSYNRRFGFDKGDGTNRYAAPQVQVRAGAGVGFSASYAAIVEEKFDFLYRAIEEVEGAAGKIQSVISWREGHDDSLDYKR